MQIACIPPVSENKSAISPAPKDKTNISHGFMLGGNTITSNTYKMGVTNLPSCKGSNTIVCSSKTPKK